MGQKRFEAKIGRFPLRLVELAYPDLQEEVREQLALTHYLGQLEHQQLAFSVKQKCPKTVDEAVSATEEMKSYYWCMAKTMQS